MYGVSISFSIGIVGCYFVQSLFAFLIFFSLYHPTPAALLVSPVGGCWGVGGEVAGGGGGRGGGLGYANQLDRKGTRLNSSTRKRTRRPSSA